MQWLYYGNQNVFIEMTPCEFELHTLFQNKYIYPHCYLQYHIAKIKINIITRKYCGITNVQNLMYTVLFLS